MPTSDGLGAFGTSVGELVLTWTSGAWGRPVVYVALATVFNQALLPVHGSSRAWGRVPVAATVGSDGDQGTLGPPPISRLAHEGWLRPGRQMVIPPARPFGYASDSSCAVVPVGEGCRTSRRRGFGGAISARVADVSQWWGL
jgi:hypothetical protein